MDGDDKGREAGGRRRSEPESKPKSAKEGPGVLTATGPLASDDRPAVWAAPLPERIAHYRIEGEKGRGGMGLVYRAEDTRLERTVAVKVLPDALVVDGRRRAWFEREAKLLADSYSVFSGLSRYCLDNVDAGFFQ